MVDLFRWSVREVLLYTCIIYVMDNVDLASKCHPLIQVTILFLIRGRGGLVLFVIMLVVLSTDLNVKTRRFFFNTPSVNLYWCFVV